MNIIPLAQIDPKQVETVGYKAASLSRLRRGKFSVPEGFVITNQSCRLFFEENHLTSAIAAEMDKLNVADLHSIDYASRTINDLITRAEFSPELGSEILQQYAHLNTPFVAVRSSPYAGKDYASVWAGGLLTSLNVSADNILQTVKQCWASLYSTRCLYYLAQLHIAHDAIAMPVIIQRMVSAQVSGIAYTAHPVHRDRNQMVIEACAGLGELLAAGRLTPDDYVIDKKARGLLEKKISEQSVIMMPLSEGGAEVKDLDPVLKQPKLTEEQIFALVDLCVSVERLYRAPVELEWVLADDFYLVQAKKMTAI
jgi:pyruvate, water dikinase